MVRVTDNRRKVLLILLAFLAATPAVVADMTQENIREAIAYGAKQKRLGLYELGGSFKTGPIFAGFTTPFLRIALASSEAAGAYKTFSEADVTPEMIAPELWIYAPAIASGRYVINVKAIVVFGPDKALIQPLRTKESIEEFGNAYGARFSGKGLEAWFPLSVITRDHEVRVILDSGSEKKARFPVDKVR